MKKIILAAVLLLSAAAARADAPIVDFDKPIDVGAVLAQAKKSAKVQPLLRFEKGRFILATDRLCDDDSDCGSRQVCQSGRCASKEDGHECDSDRECARPKWCNNGKCE